VLWAGFIAITTLRARCEEICVGQSPRRAHCFNFSRKKIAA